MPMTYEEKQALAQQRLQQSFELLRSGAHIRPHVIIDQPRIETRNQRDRRKAAEKEKRDADKREQEKREQQEIKRQAAEDTTSLKNWVTAQIENRTTLLTDATCKFLDLMYADLRNEFTAKYTDLSAQLERVSSNYQREIERERTAHQRELDAVAQQSEMIQAIYARERAAMMQEVAALKRQVETMLPDGGQFESAFDWLNAAFDRSKRMISAQIRRVA
jgi:hypothetical protein